MVSTHDLTGWRIGWIGAGAMGQPICQRLLAAGANLTVYDIDGSRLQPLVAAGAYAAESIAQVCESADFVFSMVFDDAALREAVLGRGGVLASLGPDQVFIDMSTVTPGLSGELAERMAEKQLVYLRAPVSGSTALAQTGSLAVLASGDREIHERCVPILKAFSARQVYLGGGETARIIKLLVNLILVVNTAVIGEALILGEQAGVGRDVIVDAVNDSIVGSAHYKARAQSLKTQKYNGNGPLRLVAKDLDMALEMAHQSSTPLPLTALVRQCITVLLNQGLGDYEVSLLADFLSVVQGQNPKELKL